MFKHHLATPPVRFYNINTRTNRFTSRGILPSPAAAHHYEDK